MLFNYCISFLNPSCWLWQLEFYHIFKNLQTSCIIYLPSTPTRKGKCFLHTDFSISRPCLHITALAVATSLPRVPISCSHTGGSIGFICQSVICLHAPCRYTTSSTSHAGSQSSSPQSAAPVHRWWWNTVLRFFHSTITWIYLPQVSGIQLPSYLPRT